MIRSVSWVTRQIGPSSTNVPGLDGIRVAAAFLVMVAHFRNLFFCDYTGVIKHGWGVNAFYFLTGLGRQAVMVFFVLSGFLVGRNVVEAVQGGSWSWVRYAIERGTRLCIVLWPALLLTFCLDFLGDWLFSYDKIGFGSNVVPRNLGATSSLKVYFLNAFFLQGVSPPSAGTNSVLWSLSNEFWYYLTFPVLLLSIHPSTKSRHRVAYVLIAVVIYFLLRRGAMRGGFLIWLMGVGAAYLATRIPIKRSRLVLIFSLAVFGATIVSIRFYAVLYSDYLVGLATAVLCFAMLQVRVPKHGLASVSARFLSSFSYTLYLTHVPLLVLLQGLLLKTDRWQPVPVNLVVGSLVCLAATIWAYCVYRLTERYTPQLRQLLLERFNQHTPRSSNDLREAA